MALPRFDGHLNQSFHCPLGNGLAETRDFDARYFPQRVLVPGRLDWSYTVDGVGNPTQIVDGLSAASDRTYGYQDYQYFLTSAAGPWGPSGTSLQWTYDKIGDRLTEAQPGEPLPFNYSYLGTTPKLTRIQPRPHGSGSGTLTFSYDAAGNETSVLSAGLEGSGQTTTFTYSFEDKLSHLSFSSGPAATDFLYDGRGFLRDALRTYGNSTDFEHTEPIYGSEGLLYSRRWRRQSTYGTPQDNAPAPTLTADETAYVFYFAGRPVAELIPGGAGLLYLTTDHLGTPALATDPTGATIWQGGFTPFGAPYQLLPSSLFLRLPGQWDDTAWGGARVFYNVNRWIDPASSRYATVDQVGMGFGIAPTPYLYAAAGPTKNTDPLGLFVLDKNCSDPAAQGGIPGIFRVDPHELQAGIDDMCSRIKAPGGLCYQISRRRCRHNRRTGHHI